MRNDLYDDTIKAFSLYIEGIISADELFALLHEHFEGNEDLREPLHVIALSREVNRRHHTWFCKPVSEFSLQDCPRLDKSYSQLPEDFPEALCSGRTEEIQLVLNDKWVSVPQGSEHFTFKCKNTYEEAMFKCEDERYKLDHEIFNLESLVALL